MPWYDFEMAKKMANGHVPGVVNKLWKKIMIVTLAVNIYIFIHD